MSRLIKDSRAEVKKEIKTSYISALKNPNGSMTPSFTSTAPATQFAQLQAQAAITNVSVHSEIESDI